MARKKKRSMKLGGGGRFAKVKEEAAERGARDPGAVAASVGIKKYGKKKMGRMAKKGKRRARRSRRG
jgi:hypothetical protein